MKNKLLKLFLIIFTISLSVFPFACGGGGNSEPSREVSTQFLSVMDGTFTSAEYQVMGSSTNSEKGGSEKKPFSIISPTNPTYWLKIEELATSFYGTGGGVPLTEDNKKALKGEALSDGSGFAAMARALADEYGDNLFNEGYTYQDVTFKVTGDTNQFTINGVINEEGYLRSGFQMTFTKEPDDTYSYVFAQYSSYSNFSELKFSSFAPNGVMNVYLRANDGNGFTSYDADYDRFKIEKITVAYFPLNNYASTKFNNANPASRDQVERTMKFVKEILGFSNQTYSELKGIKNTKNITSEEATRISNKVAESYYVCPYYYQTNTSYVREEYNVPSNVTVVKTGSSPATKRVYIHGNVTKIESRPFQQPQHLEELVFTDPTTNKLTQIGSFDESTGRPSFILSMTKVKNFILPSSVKKLELGDYVLNTEVELIDLSSYNPTFLTDSSDFTYSFKSSSSKADDYIKDEYRNNAYVKLSIGAVSPYYYKEIRFINKLKMPKFNMGIDFDAPNFYSVKDAKGFEYYYEASKNIEDLLKVYDNDEVRVFEELNYTKCYEVIGELIVNTNNVIVPKNLLYGDISNSKNFDERDDFDVSLYKFYDDNKGGASLDNFRTVKTIYIDSKYYERALNSEKRQSDRLGDSIFTGKPLIVINGASSMGFSDVEVSSVYLSDGSVKAVSDIEFGEKFLAPNLEGDSSYTDSNGERKYFVGWSFTENGSIAYIPFSEITNNMQTLYPVYSTASDLFNFTLKSDGTYYASYKGNSDLEILVVPSIYNGKAVTELVKNDKQSDFGDVETMILGHGIKYIRYGAISSVRPDNCLLPSSIVVLEDIYSRSENYFNYGNACYLPVGKTPFGAVIEEEYGEFDSVVLHEDTTLISRDAFSGSDFENITIKSKVKYIGACAFAYSGIESIVIPTSVELIDICAFVDCDNLNSVVIGEGVKKLGTQAFSSCDNLKNVTLPSSLETLASDVFEYCYNIEGTTYENGVYIKLGNNAYGVLIDIVDPYVDTFKVHDNTEFLSFDFESSSDASKIYLGKNLKEISLNLIFDFHNYFTVYYKGSQSDWNNIRFTGYETILTWQEVLNSGNYDYDLQDMTLIYNS